MAKKAGGRKFWQSKTPPDPVQRDKQLFLRWLILIAVLIVLVALTAVSCSKMNARTAGITPSTRQRTKLASGLVRETDYYTDSLGRISNRQKLLTGMKYFYRKTGIQPYLYLTDTIGPSPSPSEEEMAQAADKLYSGLFQDEGHLLLLYYENAEDSADHRLYCCTGSAAQTVADEEACDIILDYIDTYYYNDSRYPAGSESQLFSDAFENAAKDMMSIRSRAWWIAALAVLMTLILAVVLIDFRKAWNAQKQKADEKTGSVPNTPLPVNENRETRNLMESLEKKYSVRKDDTKELSAEEQTTLQSDGSIAK